ncbi:MAG: FemAB family PEP-CTERM system-associated protein [Acidobacteria bacterium]|nr:FemAB family PEP-CTERM system-associated protein [Acidobacteriota bacterium]
MTVRLMDPIDAGLWDNYVRTHSSPSIYHLTGWLKALEQAYGHKTYYLVCLTKSNQPSVNEQVSAILPLVHMKHVFFGNRLVSVPYCDYGGILSTSESSARSLLIEAARLAERLQCDEIEFRHRENLSIFNDCSPLNGSFLPVTKSHKVRMVLKLPDSSDTLFGLFKPKLRSQIRRPQKAGLWARIGGLELLEHFYQVFSANMRDLGSPVHSRRLIQAIMQHLGDAVHIFIIYQDNVPLSCSMVIGLGNLLANPWSSSLKSYNSLSPNMLLYWKMLEYACDNGFGYFDFGRSTPSEGTYRFKQQWGADAHPLFWQYLSIGKKSSVSADREDAGRSVAVNLWKRLPIPLANLCGPCIRKRISL